MEEYFPFAKSIQSVCICVCACVCLCVSVCVAISGPLHLSTGVTVIGSQWRVGAYRAQQTHQPLALTTDK